MRRALFGLLCLACTRAPSSVPLGGEEWVRPEPHFDRKAPGDAPQSRVAAAPPPSAAAAPAPSAATPSPPAPAAPTVPAIASGEIAFAFVPLAKGDAVSLRTRYTLRASLAISAGGTTSNQRVEADASERIEVRVIEAGAEAPRELEVEYAESRSKVSFGDVAAGDTDAGESNAGKRYRVRVSGGSATVTPVTGTLKPDEDKGVIFDLASVIGYAPLVRSRVPVSLAPGWRASVAPGEVAQVFGGLAAVRFDAASLSLTGRDPARAELALFQCTLPVRFERDGVALSANLRGTFTARPGESRPVSVVLRGPLEADNKLPFGDATKISGSLEVSLEHAYRR